MATGQDPSNRVLLDNWTTHEKLCLASAVSSLGDQNWQEISKNMKTLCENNVDFPRPADWYSEKSCALQYAHLLESEKKGSNEAGDTSETETVVKTSLKRLKDQRMQELQDQIRKDQEEYAKIQAAMERLKSPYKNLQMLQDMWREIEKEEEAERIREMKWKNELREREQRKQEIEGNLQTGTDSNTSTSPVTTTTTTTATATTVKQETTAVDMDVDEIIGVSKPMQTAISPLLSSLLKSPTSIAPPPPPPPPSSSNVTTSVRAAAPTITTLLTSGTIPKSNQPAITLNTDLIPPEKAIQLLTRPISGPPSGDSLNVSNAAAQNLLSPSQSAPTLSMLLEKNKQTAGVGNNQQGSGGPGDDVLKSSTTSTSKSNETKNEEKSMEVEEKVPVKQTKGGNDSDEEQQLMEVFKNIGNIELDIDVAAVINDEEVDFLKSVDEKSPQSTVEAVEFDKKTDEKNETNEHKESKRDEKESEKEEKDTSKSIALEKENELEQKTIKMETSSDDSNDNIPLAVLENKERASLTPTEIEAKANENISKSKAESNVQNSEDASSPKVTIVKEEVIEKLDTTDTEEERHENVEIAEKIDAAEVKCEEDDNSVVSKLKKDSDVDEKATEIEDERFSTPTGDENINETELETIEKLSTVQDSKSDVHRVDNDNAVDNSTSAAMMQTDEEMPASANNSDSTPVLENTNANETTTLPPPPPSHTSVADTDEDSCTTDISGIITSTVKREEKPTTSETRQKSERASSRLGGGTHDVSSKSTEDSDSSSGHRASKRSLISVLNNLSSTKSAQTVQQALNDEDIKSKYQKTCYKRLDFQTIKKSIESGAVRSFIDLQRDLLHFVQNVMFLCDASSPAYKAAEIFKHEMQNVREFVFNAHEFETKTEKEAKEIKQAATKQGRTGSRKSLRIS